VVQLLEPLLVVLQLDPDRFELLLRKVGHLRQLPQACGQHRRQFLADFDEIFATEWCTVYESLLFLSDCDKFST
jgi:hypothetical protein